MADAEDLKLLESGELDLSRCDFREADLSGKDLSGRNFTHSLFQKAVCRKTNFSGSDFQNAKVSFIQAADANFDDCNLQGLHFGYPDLSGATMRRVKGTRARFQHANLQGADLSGADFSSGNIDADTTLSDVISDAQTKFDNVTVLRPTSRNPLFRNYDFDKGFLRRKLSPELGLSSARGTAVENPAHSETAVIDNENNLAPASGRMVRFDHNDPDYLRVVQEFQSAVDALRTTNEHVDNREEALQSLQHAQRLWNRAELTVKLAQLGIVMLIEDALELVGKASFVVAIELVKNSVIDYLRKKIGI